MKKRQGFTLIELLIVIGIISILAAIIYVAVDPAKRFAEARDAERSSSTNAILNAMLKYTVDNRGTLPNGIATSTAATYYMIGTANSGCDSVTCSAVTIGSATCKDVGVSLVDTYIASMPIEPSNVTTYDATMTGYYYSVSSNGRITVGACDPEEAASITVTR